MKHSFKRILTGSLATASFIGIAASTHAASDFVISGLFDGYYSYNFNRPNSPNTPATGATPAANNANRFYDMYHNTMSVNMVELSVKKSVQDVTFQADFDFGNIAEQNAGGDVTKHVGQAFVTYAASPRLSFNFGKMYTHVGYEVVKSKDNWQYSRSSIFWYGIPLWHTGLSASYTLIPEKLVVTGYLYNGWNSNNDYNKDKSFGAQVKWTVDDGFVVTYNYIGGPEHASVSADWKQVHEANATYSFNSDLDLALELLHGTDKNGVLLSGATASTVKWMGSSLHAKYRLNPEWYVSPRLEYFKDSKGAFLGGQQEMYSGTLTAGHNMGSGLETRLEYRFDHSTEARHFVKKNGTSKDQMSLLAAVLYNF